MTATDRLHHVYLLLCQSSRGKYSIYVGYTTSFEERLRKHQEGKGAKYTRSHRPLLGSIVESFSSRSEALSHEHSLKRLSFEEKKVLLEAALKKRNRGKNKKQGSISPSPRLS